MRLSRVALPLPASGGGEGLTGVAGVLVASAVWGWSGILIKLLWIQTGISAPALAFWRDLGTTVALLAVLAVFRRDWLRIRRNHVGRILALGVCIGCFHIIWNLGIRVNGVAVAVVQQAAMPALVAVAARFLWREPLTASKVAALVLTFAGTLLVSGVGSLGKVRLSPTGLLLGFLIPIGYATWNLLVKRIRNDYSALTTMLYGFGIATLVLLPLQPFAQQPSRIPPTAWIWFAGLTLGTTFGGFALYTNALGHLSAGAATILSMSEIVFATIYAHFVLGEGLAGVQLLGAVLVVIGVTLLVVPGLSLRSHRQRGTRPSSSLPTP